MRKILITGKDGYIGNKLNHCLVNNYNGYDVDKISVRDNAWEELDFSKYDSVVHLAGIAHVSTNKKYEKKYFEINRDLSEKIAKKSKLDGVKHFIFMSSIIVYGDATKSVKNITNSCEPIPSNFYGESKLQAEKRIKDLEDKDFLVSIIRPPMVYGEESKGNFEKLFKISKLLAFVPYIENERSIIYIDNLTEFIKEIIDGEKTGIFLPPNNFNISTHQIIKNIRQLSGKKTYFFKMNKSFFWIMTKLTNTENLFLKIFGNISYSANKEEKNSKYKKISFNKSLENILKKEDTFGKE